MFKMLSGNVLELSSYTSLVRESMTSVLMKSGDISETDFETRGNLDDKEESSEADMG